MNPTFDHFRLSLVLPCYNEEANIERTVQECLVWMKEKGIGGEVIAVDDGSTDSTPAILQEIRNPKSEIRNEAEDILLQVVTHPTNLGYGAAVRSGCDSAKEEWIAFMDSDGQFAVKDFEKLIPWCTPPYQGGDTEVGIKKNLSNPPPTPSLKGRGGPARWEEKLFHFITGRRRKRADPFMRKVNAKLFGFLSFLVLGIWVRDINCAMKIFHRSVWQKCRPTIATGALFNAEFFYHLKKAGIQWKQVDVDHFPRKFGIQTGANMKVILGMFRELWRMKK